MAFKTYTMPNGRKLTFVSEKAMRQYFANLAREESRKTQGKTDKRHIYGTWKHDSTRFTPSEPVFGQGSVAKKPSQHIKVDSVKSETVRKSHKEAIQIVKDALR